MRILVATGLFLLLIHTAFSQSFEGSKIGNGIRFVPKDSSFSTQFNVRFQNLYIGEYNLDEDTYDERLLTRRFRLKFKGFLADPKIQYKIELALSNRDQGGFDEENNGAASIVLDAVLKWKFHKNWQLWVGQTKLPGNRERVISSGNLQFTDRSRLNSRYTIDRDKGIQIRHEDNLGNMVFRQLGAISLGEGRNITATNTGGYDYTYRVELLPFGKFSKKGDYFGGDLVREQTPKLSLAAGFNHNSGTNRSRGQLGDFLDTESDLTTFITDLMFKYKGYSIMSEYTNKKVTSGANFGLDESGDQTYFYTGQAFNFSTGYNWPNNVELAVRYVYNEPESFSDGSRVAEIENRYTLNIGKYIAGHTLKIQASAGYIDMEDSSDELLFMGMMEIGF